MSMLCEMCGFCRYFQLIRSSAFPDTNGVCRRRAPAGPAIGNGRWSLFPPTNHTEWCGEYDGIRRGSPAFRERLESIVADLRDRGCG